MISAIAHIKAAYDLGVNTFDTADCYSGGMSEIILGKAIQTLNLPRDEIVIMTKVGLPVPKVVDGNAGAFTVTPKKELERLRYTNQFGLSRKVRLIYRVGVLRWPGQLTDVLLQHIFDSVKRSLERLQLDYVDVLQCMKLQIVLFVSPDNHFPRPGHRFDPETPIEETMQALDDVVKAGYVRYIGMSSCYAWQCRSCTYSCTCRGF